MLRSACSVRVFAVILVGLGLQASLNPLRADAGERSFSHATLAALDGDKAGALSGGVDIPWSGVVREIQRELRDLGLYTGPVDGRYSVEVKEAVDRFERLHGSIGEGTPLTDTLRSIVSVRDALKLRRNLDTVRERQTEAALQALRASPETRDLVDDRPRAADGAAADPASCGARVTVDCLLAEARRSAAGTAEKNFHDWALREIILTEVRTGRGASDVRDRLRQLSDPRLVLVSMREIAETMAQNGRIAEATELADTVPDPENRVRALSAIAVSAAKQGKTVEAAKLTERVLARLRVENTLTARVSIATALASGLAEAGDLDGARDVIGAAKAFAPGTAGLIRRAEAGMATDATARGGDDADSLEASAGVAGETSATMIVGAASAVSRASRAEQDRYRVPTLCDLAVVQAKAGNASRAAVTIGEATTIASGVRKGYPRDYAWFSIALAWARIGGFDEAGAALDRLDNDLLHAEGLWRVAEAAARAGATNAADSFERQAHSAATRIDSRFDRAMLLGDMAVAAAGVRRTETARKMLNDALRAGRALDVGWWRARAFARLATALHVVSNAERVR